MDIVKRAYMRVKEDCNGYEPSSEFFKLVELEVIRLIRVRAYSGRDWPREFGPIPDELRSKR